MIQKGVGGQPIYVDAVSRAEVCGETLIKESYIHRKESIQAPNTIHLKGNKMSGDLNYGMGLVFIDYGRSLN